MSLTAVIASFCLVIFVKLPSAASQRQIGPVRHANCECSGTLTKGPQENKSQSRDFRLTCKRTELL
ncbi:hypothetical protein Bhyg_14199 [Pseudolycoriella hygida]|uniref:Secreted protein n=1 Tax=Pseudolycoriella hygida TaxID=35572 RepID=A0A9Q0MPD6_9DIPT|nr:hypothetical protein Bhyg_14199 [Pseudolycoriella hygida]